MPSKTVIATLICLALPALAAAQAAPAPQPEPVAAASQEAPPQPGTFEQQRAKAAAAGDVVGERIPLFAGAKPADQARSIAWILTLEDDRKLVALFPELNDHETPLAERGKEARRRLEELAGVLRSRGHAVNPPRGPKIARSHKDAPAPNFIPPEIFSELEKVAARGDSLEAAQALAEAQASRRAAAQARKKRE